MKHSGKAALAALKLIGMAAVAVLALLVVSWLAAHIGELIVEFYGVLIGFWLLFTVFCFFFFR
ncbi:MAG: hypothetical protein KGR98_14125, partial [Verrucomicrobia bacterium]|nr:hypothetical protein [Verrucomicrobiota bacterium]